MVEPRYAFGHPPCRIEFAGCFLISMQVAIVSVATLRTLATLGTRQGKVRGLTFLAGMSILRCISTAVLSS